MTQKILIIEDDKSVQQLIRMYLVNDGFEVIFSMDGKEGLDKALNDNPDLILLDLNLPKIDGIEICKKVRINSDVPIIMVTAKIEELDRLDGLENGADDYITKPFSPRELVARVKAVLRRVNTSGNKQVQISENIQSGDIYLDTASRRVRIKENNVTVTPTEYRLLNFFIESSGRVVSRDQIIESVFGYDFSGYDRTVDTHISNLRKKLENSGLRKGVFSTVYGMGYRFDSDIS
jgi:DNA-binding response OmpR family regulator